MKKTNCIAVYAHTDENAAPQVYAIVRLDEGFYPEGRKLGESENERERERE